VTLLILARPFLARYQGRTEVMPQAYDVAAGFEHARPAPIRREYLRARIRAGRVVIHAHQGSGVLASTTWADGLVQVEPGQSVRAGDRLPYLPFSELLS